MKAKFATIGLSLALVLGAAAPASALTVADLQAQINALMAQLAALQGGSAMTTGAAITSDLTVGSRGADVTTLQNALIAQGNLGAGFNTGYFGALTKAAVMKWQAAVGLPSTGYFGPLSRAKFNGSAGATGTVPGTTIGGGTTVGGSISTPGAEGTLSVTSAPVSSSTVYAGDSKDPVLAFKAQATNSDVLVQRVKIDLGTSANVYNKVFSTVYLLNDQGAVVASSPLNTSTVVKDADSHYYVTLSGFSSLVARGTTRTFTVAMDLMSSIDSTYRVAYTIELAASGVRAIDGAGISLYSPTNATDVTRSVTVASSLTDTASLTVSADPSTPLAREVVASTGSSNNQADKVVLLVFDIRADKADVNLTDLKGFTISKSAAATTAATASTTYLFEGNGTGGTLLGSAALTTNTANFTNISSTVPKGTTKTYTIAADIQSADAVQATFTAALTGNTTNVVGLASNGTTIGTVTGTATGNNTLVRNVGPIFTLNSAPTITYTAAAGVAGATSTAKAHFDLHIKAVGTDVEFGGSASTTYPLVGWGNLVAGTSTPIYLNGASTITTSNVNAVSSSTALTVPASGLVTSGVGANSYKLQQNNEVNIGVDYIFEGRQSCGSVGTCTGTLISTGSYAVALERLNWLTNATGRQSSTFMVGDTNWRTGTIVMP